MKEYYCPCEDVTCPYFKRESEDWGICRMTELECCSPVDECDAFENLNWEEIDNYEA